MFLDPISKHFLDECGDHGPVSLMYHSISPGASKPNWLWSTSFNRFRDQLALLQDFGWTTVCANELLDIKKLPQKSVLLTFDDGYADNYCAFEELFKRNMKANWFVVTKDLGRMSSWADDNAPSLPLLSQSQLLEMQNSGMEIGSHTHSHCRLTQISKHQLSYELTSSQAILSDLLEKKITSFAYPYGLYNKGVLSATESSGYRVAFTTRSGFGLIHSNTLEVRRVSIMANDTLSRFARKLIFADNDVNWTKMGRYISDRIKDRLK